MQEIITAFGIDWRLIAIQIFNFVVLLLALWYFLYTPVLAMIERRRSTIEGGVRDAELAAQKLAAAQSEHAQVLKAAHAEAVEVARRAKDHADIKAAELVHAAEEKSRRTMEEAKREGELLKERLYNESEAQIAQTALLAAEKILKERAS